MFLEEMQEDIEAFKQRDPAARSTFEIIFLYQGFHALMFYRVSHFFWRHEWKFFGRLIVYINF